MQTGNKQTCSFRKQSFKTKSVQVAFGNNEHIKEQKSDSYWDSSYHSIAFYKTAIRPLAPA